MREAIVQAVDRGYTACEVVELAGDGRFDGLPPFEVAENTVNDVARKARLDRTPEQHAPASDPTVQRMRKLAEKTIERLEGMETPGAKDLSALREAHRVLEQLDRADRRRLPAAETKPGHQPSESESDLVERMQADIDAHLRAVAAGARAPTWSHGATGTTASAAAGAGTVGTIRPPCPSPHENAPSPKAANEQQGPNWLRSQDTQPTHRAPAA